MPIATYRGEQDVAAIADKMYTNLTPRQRERAEAAILKANPQLSDLRAVPAGAVLRIPEIPELRPKVNRTQENPDAQVAATVADVLDSFVGRVNGRIATEDAQVKVQTRLLGSAPVKEALSKEPSMLAVAEAAAQRLDTRAAVLSERQKALKDALAAATGELTGSRRRG